MIKKISCEGYRGFSSKQILNLAIPNGEEGSGLTMIIGPNGGGKSTLIECLSKFSNQGEVSFTEGKRNKNARDIVQISILDEKSNKFDIETVPAGGSETIKKGSGELPKIYFLPSRRVFNPYFSKAKWTRKDYIQNPEQHQFRAQSSTNITYRLFTALDNIDKFNGLFWRILGQKLEWTIDQDDSNNYYIKVQKANSVNHNSDGLGEGIVSLLFLCDALYDLQSNETIVIDEPELSLHPQLQSRLLNEILEITRNEQVVLATHSPNMISIKAAINGGAIARVHENKEGSIINSIDDKCREYFKSFTTDVNNPHVLGNEARASLFTEDGLILTEGQEDVVLIPEIIDKLGLNIKLPFFGFGSGGASKIPNITYILKMLGFLKIGALFDGDKKEEYEKYCKDYEEFGYKAWLLPADDIRDKMARTISEKKGILTGKFEIKNEYVVPMKNMMNEMEGFIKTQS